MEPPFALLEQVKTLLLQKKLSSLSPYEEAREDSEAAWKKFRLAHTGEVRGEALDLLDRRDGAWSWGGWGNSGTGNHKTVARRHSSNLCRNRSTARRSMRDTWT